MGLANLLVTLRLGKCQRKWATRAASKVRGRDGPRKPAVLTKRSAAHWDACELRGMPSGCAQCKFISLRHRWQKRLLISADDPKLGSWLVSRGTGKRFRVGCAACALANKGNSAGVFGWSTTGQLQLCNLKWHAACPTHQDAIANITGKPAPAKESVAPTEDQFMLVLESTKSGSAVRRIAGVGHRRKVQKMQYCLAEACRAADRKFLRKAASIAVHPDSKGKRYGCRFSASQKDLSVLKGSFGQALHIKHGIGAQAIRRSLEQLITEFCTPCHGAPPRGKQPKRKPECDAELRDHIINTIEVYDPDRAADEQSAGMSMRDCERTFKKLKIVTYDHAHAARRSLPPDMHMRSHCAACVILGSAMLKIGACRAHAESTKG